LDRAIASNAPISGLTTSSRPTPVVVSFTSYPGRIHSAARVAHRLLDQTVKPDRILLWLTEQQFPERQVPQQFQDLQELGLTICWARDSLKAHTKYFFTMAEFPSATVITVDDDVVYPRDLIEVLLRAHTRHPRAVIARRAHRITFGPTGRPLPYNRWQHQCRTSAGPAWDLFATGVGGVLYPPNSLSELTFHKDEILRLCLDADDIWLKAMELLARTPVVLTQPMPILLTAGSQGQALALSNVGTGGNTKILNAVFDAYGVWDVLDRLARNEPSTPS
jgi:hypothetical protein